MPAGWRQVRFFKWRRDEIETLHTRDKGCITLPACPSEPKHILRSALSSQTASHACCTLCSLAFDAYQTVGRSWRRVGAVRPSSRPHRHPRRGLRSSLLTEEPMTPPHALLVPAAGTGCSAPTFDRGGPSWDIELVVCRTDDGAAMKPGSRSSRMLTSRDLSCCGSADARAASVIKRQRCGNKRFARGSWFGALLVSALDLKIDEPPSSCDPWRGKSCVAHAA